MTGIAIAQRRFNSATLFAAMLLVAAGIVLGFALAELTSGANFGGGIDQARAGAATEARSGGLSPDDRQDAINARSGGLSPDDRQAVINARSGGLSRDEKDELARTP